MRWTHPAFESLARLLVERTGLSFAADRRAGFEAGIRRVVERSGVGDPSLYFDLVEGDPDRHALDDLIAELTVGETYFFREPEQFRFVRETVLPEVIGRRGQGHVVRAWSAGCASGEEAYSLAIVLREELGAGRSRVLATDISRDALAKARSGVFGRWSIREGESEAALPYLGRDGDRFAIDGSIREVVEPRYLNLALDAYPSTTSGISDLDLILCRNVLIYLDADAVRAVARRLFDSLSEGGWLITASSDPSLLDAAPFEALATDRGVFYRRGATPIRPPTAPDPARPPARLGPGDAPSRALVEAVEAMARDDHARAAARTLGLEGAEARALRVRALTRLDIRAADRASADSTARHPLSHELRLLRALVLHALGRQAEAAREAGHAVYLDRTSAMAHFTMGSILLRLGDRSGAWRAYRNARDLVAPLPVDQPVRLGDGQTAGRLARAAEAQMARLEAQAGIGRAR